MNQSDNNGKALHSLVRIFNHDLDNVIEKLKNPENSNMFDKKDSDAQKISQLGSRLCNNSDWDGIKPGKDEEFIEDLKKMKDLFLSMSQNLWKTESSTKRRLP
ncbi:MAG: hypothetical protein ABJH98_18075 [Reichenbachiella sp.]|uniref:hypothetical protein n=1 Tax=Reichenbachiella sp. TaxID=2184521 RepID=UPI003296B1D6